MTLKSGTGTEETGALGKESAPEMETAGTINP